MAEAHHYPPDVFKSLVDAIPLLCKSKKDVVIFFKGAGVPDKILNPISAELAADARNISKYYIVEQVLLTLNDGNRDSFLGVFREIIKRVVEFENYSACWPDDQLKAQGAVAVVRDLVNKKDTFTRLKQEHDAKNSKMRDIETQEKNKKNIEVQEKKQKIQNVKKELFSLFSMNENPQDRGNKLESVLNDLFSAYGILIKENFKRRDLDSNKVLEQIDGVIKLDGVFHLVEMKWLKDPVGVDDVAHHIYRVFNKAEVSGIFISNSGFTQPAIINCKEILNKKTVFLCSLKEIVSLLDSESDLLEFLDKKRSAAILEKNPFLEILS